VIEDTESTIDLAAGGWTLYNYNERLAFSATPPDFGSLAIQRNRWANGGLLILPKMWRAVRERRKRGERTSIGELLLRLNYMASIFWASLFVLCLMIIPFNGHLVSPLTYAVAVPYFVAMAIDLKYCGYKYFDAARIYGFNLLLLPVNLAGSLSSLVQALTGAKGKFMRTPKVRNRTVPAFIYVVLPYLLVAWSVYTFKVAYDHTLWSASATRSSTSGSTSPPGSTSPRARRRWPPAPPPRSSRPTPVSPTGSWSSTSATPIGDAARATSRRSRATPIAPR
jgi:cellulose synthase/poly-beta-1,6-N-acetylglucosamine synthase-like glycosyltransferase